MMDEKSLQTALEKVGNNEEGVRNFFENKLSERHHNQSEEKFPINDMFTYGISGNCIHLHLPGNLHQMIAKKRNFRYNGHCKSTLTRRNR